MNDIISRQAAINECKLEFLNPNVERETEELTLIDQSFAKGWNNANSIWIKELKNLPSAEPEQKKGKWLGTDYPSYDSFECDQCGYVYEDMPSWMPNFCPNCGADMRKEEK